MSIKLIVGLRNPGASYARTRHNAGAWFVEALAESQQLVFKKDKKFNGDWVRLDAFEGHSILFMPLSFMNLSGTTVRAVCQFYDILPHEMLIVHDELDLPEGTARLKTGGGHGGHNGLRDIIEKLQTRDFHRLRIGIGHPGHRDLVTDYVLTKPSPDNKEKIMTAITHALQEMPDILAGNLAVAMTKLHITPTSS
ncbi:MAG: aminoacyl-tRNA hydrolase [Gammaproteobacteria bacterium]|nr:aminoacyl-tRNA hydrolase [Gammaproteobacteria bacterium]